MNIGPQLDRMEIGRRASAATDGSMTKFCVWMNSRWLELDPATGAIETKRHKPRFAYYRDGALHIARTSSVLRGLRALASGRPTTVTDGPPLPYRWVGSEDREIRRKKKKSRDGCKLCQREKSRFQGEARASTGVQVGPPMVASPKPRVNLSLRKHTPTFKRIPRPPIESDTSEADPDPEHDAGERPTAKPDVTVAVVKAKEAQIKLTPLKNIKKISKESKSRLLAFKKSRLGQKDITVILNVDSDRSGPVNDKVKNSTGYNKRGKDRVREASTEGMNRGKNVIARGRKSVSPQDSSDCGDFRSSEEDDSASTSGTTEVEAEANPKRDTRRTRSSRGPALEDSSDELQRPAATRAGGSVKATGDDNVITEIRLENIQETRLRRRETRTESSEGTAPRRSLRSRSLNTAKGEGTDGGRRAAESSSEEPPEAAEARNSATHQYRELIVGEEDGALVRRFLARTRGRSFAARFDGDEEYRRRVFFTLNPLVYVERCAEVARRLRERAPSKRYFAAQLGLRSVSTPGSASAGTDREEEHSDGGGGGSRPDGASDCDRMKRPVDKTKERRAPTVPREYTPLEDQAIVAWVSAGGRARLVNGNQLWRELQEQFPRITGRARTWQSLRNRYLRSLLPTLGIMALPPDHAARLRAAASTGKLKRHQRRNSFFRPPERGASSRRPGLPPRHDDDEASEASSDDGEPPRKVTRVSPNAGPPRSPRYSQVLRQFEARRRPRSGSSSPEGSPPRRQEGRSRRLFHPSAML